MNEMNTLVPNEIGVWIECCYPGCKKWRYSLDFDDPLVVPEKWYCHMNSDQSINDCSVPECLDLDEGEIFVESKFKAGCIVWAKVLGHPWNIAMVDFCPEFECYYWFNDIDSNVPSQYHVTFLGGKKVTRAWIESKFLKSFVNNSDPSFALKARVHGKKLKTHQRAEILEGCEIARSALSLSIKKRLKKYNFNSWKIVQRLETQFPNSGRESRVLRSASETNSKKNSANVVEPSDMKKSSYQTKTKAGNQTDVEEPSRKEISSCSAPVNQNDSTRDFTEPLIETQNSNVHDDSSLLDDTRSINSINISKDTIGESQANEDNGSESPQIPESQMIVWRWEDESEANKDKDKISSDKELNETIEIMGDNLDELIPSSQPSTPRQDSFSRMILRKLSEERDENYNRNDNSGKTLAAKSSISMSKVSEKLKSIKEGKRRRFASDNLEVRKSVSENVLSGSSANKENESRYLRALSEFTQRSEANSSSLDSSENTIDDLHQEKKITNQRKNLPSWFTNPDEKRIIQSQRLERLSKLSDEEDRRMYEENRRSFIKEIESAAPVVNPVPNSKDKNENRSAKAKRQFNNYMETQNVNDLLTSDEDSF